MKAGRLLATIVLAAILGCGDESADNLRDRETVADGEDPGGDARLDFSRAPLRRLTRSEIRASIAVLMPGFPIDEELVRGLPDDAFAPFDNDATTQSVSEKLLRSVNDLAEGMAKAFVDGVAPREPVLGCTPAGHRDDACLRTFVERFGKRAFRRPLAPEEIDGYVNRFAPVGEQDQSFHVAAGRVIASMLQDIEFLYRIEVGKPSEKDPSRVVLSDHAIAARMSSLLWGSMPDDGLVGQADRGELSTSAGRRAAAEAMLATPQARAHLARFHAQWVGYEQSLDSTSALTPEIKRKLREESDALVQRIVFDEKRSWLDLWRSNETFIDDELAEFYGDVPKPGSATPKWTSYGESKRRGLLGHGSLLNVDNKFDDTSPTQRGKMIRERLLCLPPLRTPPDLMVAVDEPPQGGECKLDGYRALLQNPGCAGCHKAMDLIGFGLETYDLGGRFRPFEKVGQQCPLDGKGVLLDDGVEKPFTGPGELADLLVASNDLQACLNKRVVQYTLGRPDVAEDQPTLDALADIFQKNSERLDAILVEIVASPSFALKKVE